MDIEKYYIVMGCIAVSIVFFIGIFIVPMELSKIIGENWGALISYLMCLFMAITIFVSMIKFANCTKSDEVKG